MQFHEYEMVRNWLVRSGGYTNDEIEELLQKDNYPTDLNCDDDTQKQASVQSQMWFEREWVRNGRPYYNIWPGMLEPLQGVAIDKIDPCHLKLPIQHLVLRFPATYSRLCNVLVSTVIPTATRPYPLWLMFLALRKHTADHMALLPIARRLDKPLPTREQFMAEVDVKGGIFNDSELSDDYVREAIYTAMSVTAAIALLQSNPDIIVPKPLSKDDALYEQTGDQELIEKAKRKGCFQFDVGKDIIVQPGVRRPHFAIRHMGKVPNLVPTLRPIKGCIVQRKLATSVPTGFMDEEE